MKSVDFLKWSNNYLNTLKAIKTKVIVVGLPKESPLTNVVYSQKGSEAAKKGNKKSKPAKGSGLSVAEIGAIHEYGLGDNPKRSWLRMPFMVKSKEVEKALHIALERMVEQGVKPQTQFERTGAYLRNIVVNAFRTGGYGNWQKLDQSTIDAKGSSKILVDTGTLRNSITYQVREEKNV